MPPESTDTQKETVELLIEPTKHDKSSATSSSYQHPEWYAKRKVQEKSLEDQASCFSNWFLSYLSPLLRLGSSKVIDADDIGVPSTQDVASETYRIIVEKWKEQIQNTQTTNAEKKEKYDAMVAKLSDAKKAKMKPFVEQEPSLASALFKAFGGGRIAFGILCYVLSALLQFVPVLILQDLVKYFETIGTQFPHEPFVHPWVQVIALGCLPLMTSILQTKSQVIFQHGSVFVRTAISTLLYKKSLSVSAAGRACTSTGQVVNMMSNDSTQLQRFIQFGGMILVAPLQIVISLYLISRQVGAATWVGVGFMVLLAPVNIVVFSVVGKMRRKVLKFSDLRVKMMNEILTGIRIIKFYAWEKPFKKEVKQLRDQELKYLTRLAYTAAIGFSLILLSAPLIQPILVFLTYINIQDTPLSASTAFTTVALFNIMRFPFAFLPMGMLQYIQSKISLRRLGKYLQLPDLEKYVISEPPNGPDDPSAQPGSVTIENGTFSWTNRSANLSPIGSEEPSRKKNKKEKRRGSSGSIRSSGASLSGESSNGEEADVGKDIETLRNISITINKGELVAVVGKVGCGKSSFLLAILGEMEPMNGSVVYIPKLKEDIDDSNFLSYCSQTPWVVNDTLRGNILFGREFDEERYDEVIERCALVEDLAILPAGDKTEIGEKGINLSGGQKARVSLARALYAKDTKIILLDDPLSAVDAHVGEHLFERAIADGLSKTATRILVTHHVHFLPRCDKVIVLDGGEIKHYGTYAELIAQGVDFAGAVNFEDNVEEGATADDKTSSAQPAETEIKVVDEKASKALKEKGENLTTKEEREEGAVSGKAYVQYARAGGYFIFWTMFFVQGLGRAAEILSAFWLAHWARKAVEAEFTTGGLTAKETTWYLNIYAAFGLLGVLCLTLRAILMAYHRLYASRTLHENLVTSIMKAPVSFHDVTPTGRILNRFAADMDKIDLDLTQSIGQGMGTIFSVLGAIGAIAAATKGTFLVPLVPIGYIYYIIQKWFRKTSTELQRVTSIAGSPIFSDFSQVLTGTPTIRAFNEQKRFFDQCQSSFNNFNASYNLVYLCNFWLGLRLDVLGGLICLFIGAVAVSTADTNFIPAGWLGLALSYGIEVTGFLKHGVRMIATIEADMNSVERVLFYSEKVESEAPDVVPDKDPAAGSWPSKGDIELQNASMRYRDGPLVLKSVTLKINGGEKIGVVGRTGSGKSSLMNLIFRITEMEKDGGSIRIDGVNITDIGTEILRSNLSIIPQDPVMFSNTVRYNIDPFGQATDSEIMDVLAKVELTDFVNSLPEGLDEPVAEGGENFSQGQRQLLCIARSLLRKPTILVMDEATASIDNATDALIQKMIRENFADATVLTIAHRLNTILDSDRVLVLDDGRVAEFDTPKALQHMPNGIFRGMVEKSRSSMRK
jgi:ATP-binding cassette, subfamily C (CFTR/MRP), member 1